MILCTHLTIAGVDVNINVANCVYHFKQYSRPLLLDQHELQNLVVRPNWIKCFTVFLN
jgi:hypothetical protein